MPAEFTEEEIDHYAAVVAAIIDGDADKKKRLDRNAHLAVAQARKSMPDAGKNVLATYFSSIAYLMAALTASRLADAAELAESTFELYSVAAAHIIGAYDAEGDAMPIRPEPKAKPEPDKDLDDIWPGQYL